MDELRPKLAQAAPEARVFLRELQQGPVQEAAIEVRISGEDENVLEALGAQVSSLLDATPGALDVHCDWREDAYRLKVNVREEVANRLGFTNASIGQQLAGGFEGAPVTTYWEGDRDVAVTLRLAPALRQNFGNVSGTYVTSSVTGARVPLASIADVAPVWDPGRIVRRNGVRTLTVRAWGDAGVLPSQVLNRVKPAIDALHLPAGYRISYGGESENQNETFPEMVKALLVSVIAIYLILMFQFRSVIDPLVVMAAIPLGLLGASLGLVVTGNPFGFTAFLGIVSLGGVVVRNAIILVDYIRARVEEGVPVEEAAIVAGERRLRPIFLTTMAAAVGVTPMILSGSTMWSPLGSTIAFGLVGSMFFTLLVIPVLYVMIHNRVPVPVRVPAATAVLLAFLCGFNAQAESRTITLDEAVSLAMQKNSAVKIARHKVNQSEARIREARANYFPTLDSDSTAMRLAEKQSIQIPQGALGVYPQIGPLPGTGVSLSQGSPYLFLSRTTLSQPLTQFFKIRAGVDMARAEAASARTDVSRTADEVAYKVKELYYAVLATEKRRDAVDAQVRAAELRIQETRNAVLAGVALEVKATEVRAQIAQSRHIRGQLQDTISDLKLEIANSVGIPLDTELVLTRPLAPTPVEDVRTATNPDVQSAAFQVDKARSAIKAARADYIPEISAFAQYIHQNGAPFLSTDNGAFGLEMKWTVFEFGKRHGQVQERMAQLSEAEENLCRIKRRVEIDTEKAKRKLKRADTALVSARETLAAATEAHRVTADRVQAGYANPSDLLDLEASVLNAQADLLRAEYDRNVAAADLARLAGTR